MDVSLNELFDFGADPDRDPDPGIFDGNFTIAEYRASCKHFAGSAAVPSASSLLIYNMIASHVFV